MTKRSFMGIMKYYLSRMTAVWLFLPAYAVVSVVILVIIVSGMKKAGLDGSFMDMIGVNGFDSFAMIIIFIFALIYTFDFFNSAAGCGISRRTSAIAQTLIWGMASAVVSAECMLVSLFFNLANGGGTVMAVEMLYGPGWNRAMWGESPILYKAKLFLLLMIIIWACGMAGYFIGSLFYRLPRKLSLVICIMLPVGSIVWMGNRLAAWEAQGIDDAMFEKIARAFLDFFGMRGGAFTMGNMMRGGVVFGVIGIICALLAYVFARRASIRVFNAQSGE